MQGGPDQAYGQQFLGSWANDPSAQMASQIGKTAFMTGSNYVEQNVRRSEV